MTRFKSRVWLYKRGTRRKLFKRRPVGAPFRVSTTKVKPTWTQTEEEEEQRSVSASAFPETIWPQRNLNQQAWASDFGDNFSLKELQQKVQHCLSPPLKEYLLLGYFTALQEVCVGFCVMICINTSLLMLCHCKDASRWFRRSIEDLNVVQNSTERALLISELYLPAF